MGHILPKILRKYFLYHYNEYFTSKFGSVIDKTRLSEIHESVIQVCQWLLCKGLKIFINLELYSCLTFKQQ